MTLQEKIYDEMKSSMKNGNVERRDFLRVVVGELNQKGKVLSDEIVIKELKSLKKTAVEMNNDKEIVILNEFLPTMLSDEELKVIIDNYIEENGFTNMSGMGKVMAYLKANYDAQYDGKIASGLVKSALS